MSNSALIPLLSVKSRPWQQTCSLMACRFADAHTRPSNHQKIDATLEGHPMRPHHVGPPRPKLGFHCAKTASLILSSSNSMNGRYHTRHPNPAALLGLIRKRQPRNGIHRSRSGTHASASLCSSSRVAARLKPQPSSILHPRFTGLSSVTITPVELQFQLHRRER